MKIKVPVVIIVYNRPKNTQKLLKRLDRVKPEKLIIISDGPKKNKIDIKKFNEIKKITKEITWKCEKKYITSNHNMGLIYKLHPYSSRNKLYFPLMLCLMLSIY